MNEEFWHAIDELLKTGGIVIDRPRGSAHPRFPDFLYPVDYGYIRDTHAMDGGGIDVWRGTGSAGADAIVVTVDLMKRDSEIKILINCTEDEKQAILACHNDSEFMKGILIRR